MTAGKDWHRLAESVRERRVELGMTQEEARAAGGPSTATMRLIEGALQESYQASTLRDLERALQWQRGSVRMVLAGGDPVPLDGAALRKAGPAQGMPAPLLEDGQFSLFKQLPPALVDQVWPDYLLIAGRAETAAAAYGGTVPSGAQVFPGRQEAALAAQWDDLAAQVRGLGMFPDDETLIHRIAETMALAWSVARGRQGGQSAGPVAASLDAPGTPHPVRYRTV
jgi:hypothetical protein